MRVDTHTSHRRGFLKLYARGSELARQGGLTNEVFEGLVRDMTAIVDQSSNPWESGRLHWFLQEFRVAYRHHDSAEERRRAYWRRNGSLYERVERPTDV